jgi:DNA-binding transcriptional LysR family regulator
MEVWYVETSLAQTVFLRTGMQLRATEEGQRVLRCLVASTRRLSLAVEPNRSNVI